MAEEDLNAVHAAREAAAGKLSAFIEPIVQYLLEDDLSVFYRGTTVGGWMRAKIFQNEDLSGNGHISAARTS